MVTGSPCTFPCLNGGHCVHPDSCNCSLYQATGSRCQTVTNTGFEREMTCRTWGQYNYETFDGLYYHFPGKCSYTLVRDCDDSSQSSVVIQVHNDPDCTSAPYFCARSVSLFLPWEGEVRLQKSNITFKGQSLQLPHNIHDVEMERIAQYVLVTQQHGFTLAWDGHTSSVYIKMSPEYVGRTCGLCGNFNADIRDDLRTSYGLYTQDLAMFGNSWAEMEPLQVSCPAVPSLYPSPCSGQDSHTMLKVREVCAMLLDEPFKACHEFVSPFSYMASCSNDLCLSGPNGEVVCRMLSEYARACAHAERSLDDWREHIPQCAIDCPADLVYRECITCCPVSCNVDRMCIDSKLQCLDGCYCPDDLIYEDGSCVKASDCPCEYHGMVYPSGQMVQEECNNCTCLGGVWNCTEHSCPGECSVTGDIHFQTFDGRIYTFPATCQYVLAKSRNSGRFTITVQNSPCGPNLDGACIQSVSLILDEDPRTEITMSHSGEVFISSQYRISPPYSDEMFHIQELSSMFLQVRAVAQGLRLQYNRREFRLYLQVDPLWKDDTVGLCGTFNGNIQDDFLSPSGMIESTPQLFGNSWRLSSACVPSPSLPQLDPCDTHQQAAPYASEMCDILNQDLFAPCHEYLSPGPFYRQCRGDTCKCGQPCLCSALAHYARQCRKHGVIVEFRARVSECAPLCPVTMEYGTCVSFCQGRCSALSSPQHCDGECEEGCICPSGTFYNSRTHTCVPRSQCPCSYLGAEYYPGDVIMSSAGVQVCQDGRIVSQSSIIDKMCPPGQRYLECDDLTDAPVLRGLACEQTCETHLLNLTCSAHEPCIPGCACPPGLLKHGDECFQPEACPCFWKGKEYYPGDKVTSPCHRCVCQHGSFQCVFQPCPSMCTAYGDRHYRTFDGLLFDYIGACKVYLVKSSVDFALSVMAENVDCFDSGVICRKSLIINIGKSVITFDDDSGKPSPSSLIDRTKVVLIWRAGYFTILHIPEEDISILWDRKTTIHIQAGPRWQGKLSGLCGNFDMKTVNEMRSPENMDSPTSQEFGNSWAATECVNSPDIRHPCSLSPLREPFAKRQCGILLSEVFEICHPVVDVTWFYMNCLMDTCACNRGGDCECFCTSVSAYAHRCCQQGVTVDWRSPTLCPYDCEFYNKVLGKGPYRLVTYRDRDTALAANTSGGVVFPLRGPRSAAGITTLFMMTPGLSPARPHDTSLVSFEVTGRPNYFMRAQRGGQLEVAKFEERRLFQDQSTFILHRDTWISGYDSLESFARRGFFLHYTRSRLQLMKYNHTDGFRRATLFRLTGFDMDASMWPRCQWRYESCVSPCFRTCSDPTGQLCVTIPKVEGCIPQCPGHMVLDEVTQRCVNLEDCIKPPVAVAPTPPRVTTPAPAAVTSTAAVPATVAASTAHSVRPTASQETPAKETHSTSAVEPAVTHTEPAATATSPTLTSPPVTGLEPEKDTGVPTPAPPFTPRTTPKPPAPHTVLVGNHHAHHSLRDGYHQNCNPCYNLRDSYHHHNPRCNLIDGYHCYHQNYHLHYPRYNLRDCYHHNNPCYNLRGCYHQNYHQPYPRNNLSDCYHKSYDHHHPRYNLRDCYQNSHLHSPCYNLRDYYYQNYPLHYPRYNPRDCFHQKYNGHYLCCNLRDCYHQNYHHYYPCCNLSDCYHPRYNLRDCYHQNYHHYYPCYNLRDCCHPCYNFRDCYHQNYPPHYSLRDASCSYKENHNNWGCVPLNNHSPSPNNHHHGHHCFYTSTCGRDCHNNGSDPADFNHLHYLVNWSAHHQEHPRNDHCASDQESGGARGIYSIGDNNTHTYITAHCFNQTTNSHHNTRAGHSKSDFHHKVPSEHQVNCWDHTEQNNTRAFSTSASCHFCRDDYHQYFNCPDLYYWLTSTEPRPTVPAPASPTPVTVTETAPTPTVALPSNTTSPYTPVTEHWWTTAPETATPTVSPHTTEVTTTTAATPSSGICTPLYTEIIDECTKYICVGGQLMLLNKSENCPYNSIPPNCGLLGFAVQLNGDKCCPQWDCPCRCSLFPDLNVITFDGNSVAIFKAASYIVTKLPDETVSIQVQECQTSDTLLWNFTNLCLVALNITHKSHQILINRLQRRLYVNSRYAKPRFRKYGYEVLDTGNMYLIRTPAGLKIQWFHSTGMMVIEADGYGHKLSTMGLCGCCDGNPANDLTLSSGLTVGEGEDPVIFIDSWQVPNTTVYVSHSRRREFNCSTTDCSECLGMLSNHSFGSCRAYVPPTMFCEVWVRDTEYVQNPCVALAAYAASCHKFNICVEWRSPEYCPFSCPDELRYQACLPACTAQTCPNHELDSDPEECSGLTEGCVCPEGTLLHRPYSALCIPASKCACTDSFGNPRSSGEVWKASLDGCCMYKCDNDTIFPVEYNCSSVPQPVCRRAGEVTVSLADDKSCCPRKACVCNQTLCDIYPPVCKYGEKLVSYYREDSCCPDYMCECDPELCEPDITVCREDQTLILTRAEGSCCLAHICMCAACTEVTPDCQEGEVLTVDANSTDLCCPIYQCVCEPYRCADIYCPEGMSQVSVAVPEQCCPLRTCECKCESIRRPKCDLGEIMQLDRDFLADPKNQCGCKKYMCERDAVCVDGVRGVMRPGQTLVEHSAEGICYTTQCTSALDPHSGFYRIRTSSTNCSAPCQPNQIYIPPNDQTICCGVCRNISCMYQNDNGSVSLSKPGKTWVSQCTKYECAATVSGPTLVSYSFSCPPFNETECIKWENEVRGSGLSLFPFPVSPMTPTVSTNCERGKEDGKSCQKVTVRMTIRKNDCRSNRPVNIVSCDGKCPSASIYNYNMNTYARFCKCCRDLGLQRRSVQLYCTGNSTWVNYSIQEPTDCSCQWA
ncbi:otogelin [Conger conger]|uniref:otogelin n=1 Tax=Conger conger TaxID=82655 RepID=UPI002A5A73E9|nr:otogelin [Conger conger]